MTLDEYMEADYLTRDAELGIDEAQRLLEVAIWRIADLTADRDSWRDQCMEARKDWQKEYVKRIAEYRSRQIAEEALSKTMRAVAAIEQLAEGSR